MVALRKVCPLRTTTGTFLGKRVFADLKWKVSSDEARRALLQQAVSSLAGRSDREGGEVKVKAGHGVTDGQARNAQDCWPPPGVSGVVPRCVVICYGSPWQRIQTVTVSLPTSI